MNIFLRLGMCDNNSKKLYLTGHLYTLLYHPMCALYTMLSMQLTCIPCIHFSIYSTARTCMNPKILEKLFNAFEDDDLGKLYLLSNALMNGRNSRKKKCFKLMQFVYTLLTFKALFKIIICQCFGFCELGTITENYFR